MFAPRGWLKRPVPRMIYRTVQGSDLFDKAWYRSTQLSALEKLVDPIWHYLDTGWKKGLDPSPRFDTNYYLRTNPDVEDLGLNPLFHYLKYGIGENRHPVATSLQELERLEPSASALRLITVPGGSPARLSMVIDDYTPRDSGAPYARVLLAGFELASSRSVRLRIIDRRSLADDLQLSAVAALTSVKAPVKTAVDFVALGAPSDAKDLPYYGDEIFVATSWSSAQSLLKGLSRNHILYLVSDDEVRLHGDDDAGSIAASVLRDLGEQTIALRPGLQSTTGANNETESVSLAWASSFSAPKPRLQPQRRKTAVVFDLDPQAAGHRVGSTLSAVSDAVAEGILDARKHDVVLLSPTTKPVNLSASLVPETRSIATVKELMDTAANCDVLVTLARPSTLGLLELAVLDCGGTVITRYGGAHPGPGKLVSITLSEGALRDALRRNLATSNG